MNANSFLADSPYAKPEKIKDAHECSIAASGDKMNSFGVDKL
jgi:hypothetical protein